MAYSKGLICFLKHFFSTRPENHDVAMAPPAGHAGFLLFSLSNGSLLGFSPIVDLPLTVVQFISFIAHTQPQKGNDRKDFKYVFSSIPCVQLIHTEALGR